MLASLTRIHLPGEAGGVMTLIRFPVLCDYIPVFIENDVDVATVGTSSVIHDYVGRGTVASDIVPIADLYRAFSVSILRIPSSLGLGLLDATDRRQCGSAHGLPTLLVAFF